MPSEIARDYFEFIAKLGMTKHYGSMQATRELAELCHIGSGHYVLDVGCGVGATPVYLAKTAGCRVVGVDLLERMIEQSRERAKVAGVLDRVEFTVADARRLPFEDDLFDAVLTESVNVFFDAKPEATSEYVRVTRPGGYVGTTEMTWLRPPTPEAVEYYKWVAYIEALEADGWIELLKQAGLKEVVGTAHPVDIPAESKGRFERYGCWGIAKVMLNTLALVTKDRGSRKYLSDGTRGVAQGLLEITGYGVYAGRKG
jgi:arsenite methyltransferase